MVPKESGFNQSETASGWYACLAWRFPCSSATARDGEVIQRQHFCHHGGTICHPKTSYVTTKLHGTSTCGCNNNAIFSDRAIFTFPTVAVCRPRKTGRGKALAVGAKLARWQRRWSHYVSSLQIRFRLSTVSNIMITVYCKVVQWDTM